MARNYNPNRRSGRRNIRDRNQWEYEQMTPEQKMERDSRNNGCQFVFFIIVMIIALIVIAMGGKIK